MINFFYFIDKANIYGEIVCQSEPPITQPSVPSLNVSGNVNVTTTSSETFQSRFASVPSVPSNPFTRKFSNLEMALTGDAHFSVIDLKPV